MSDLIQPVVDAAKIILATMDATTLGELPAFRFVGSGWKGNLLNPPSAWVMPIRTQFTGDGDSTARNQIHQVTVRLGIQGTDPDQLLSQVMAYVQAVDAAITAAPSTAWPPYVLHVFLSEHDYGQMYAANNGSLAFWPDLHLLITTEELP